MNRKMRTEKSAVFHISNTPQRFSPLWLFRLFLFFPLILWISQFNLPASQEFGECLVRVVHASIPVFFDPDSVFFLRHKC